MVKSASSDYSQKSATDADGGFEAGSLPPGAYTVTVSEESFAPAVQQVVIGTGTAPILHFPLAIGKALNKSTYPKALPKSIRIG